MITFSALLGMEDFWETWKYPRSKGFPKKYASNVSVWKSSWKKTNNKWIIFVYKENNNDTEELEIKAPSFEQLQSQE